MRCHPPKAVDIFKYEIRRRRRRFDLIQVLQLHLPHFVASFPYLSGVRWCTRSGGCRADGLQLGSFMFFGHAWTLSLITNELSRFKAAQFALYNQRKGQAKARDFPLLPLRFSPTLSPSLTLFLCFSFLACLSLHADCSHEIRKLTNYVFA